MREIRTSKEVVNRAKKALDIDKPNNTMTDNEVRLILKYIGCQAQKIEFTPDAKVIFEPIVIQMLFHIVMAEFPDFLARRILEGVDNASKGGDIL